MNVFELESESDLEEVTFVLKCFAGLPFPRFWSTGICLNSRGNSTNLRLKARIRLCRSTFRDDR